VPITITSGGTYSGQWQSLDPNVPAVTIATDQPVTIVNSVVDGKGTLIYSKSGHSDITIRNVTGYAHNPNVYGKPTGFFLDDGSGLTNLTVESSYMEGTRGIVVDANSRSVNKIRIWGNRALNIDGRHSDGQGGWINSNDDTQIETSNFVQFQNIPSIASGEIAWNQVKNIKDQSRVEDNINMYKTNGSAGNPIRIHDNFIDGAYKLSPLVKDANGFAGGGIIVDYQSSYIQIYNNQVLNTTNYGVSISAGHDNVLSGNRVMSDEILPDSNVGVYIWNSYHLSDWGNNSGTNNKADWANGNDFWYPDAASWSGNSHSDMTSTGEYQLWQSKLTQNGIVLP
jgi:parallel beta-helix repeat protein